MSNRFVASIQRTLDFRALHSSHCDIVRLGKLFVRSQTYGKLLDVTLGAHFGNFGLPGEPKLKVLN
jgi:hypothetical protein